ncbi:hypothetical protein NDN08_005165 [Rhodosorus marinus]|uniref:PRORP domain-containing protein n=1 Tax=Rhodosorus marinus TaxID=101924 RepID=A0AAV8V505_9RHOD|nr:hypothetical protein NDN08_005165 [Rhodosorus marinus]
MRAKAVKGIPREARNLAHTIDVKEALDAFWRSTEEGSVKGWGLRRVMVALRTADEPKAFTEAMKVKNATKENRTLPKFGDAENTILIQLAAKHSSAKATSDTLELLREEGVTIKRRLYLPVLEASLEAGNTVLFFDALKNAADAGVKFTAGDYFEFVLSMIRSENSTATLKLFRHLRDLKTSADNPLFSRAEALNILAAAQRSKICEVKFISEMGLAGKCPECSTALAEEAVDTSDLDAFIDALKKVAFRGQLLRTYVENLDKWLATVGPFEVVIDSANVCYDKGFEKQTENNVDKLFMISIQCDANGQSHCFVASEGMNPVMRRLIDAGKSVVYVPSQLNDDSVILYIALWSHRQLQRFSHGKVVTNDNFRDVVEHMSKTVDSRPFSKWKARACVSHEDRAVNVMQMNARGGHYAEKLQSDAAEDYWHIPVNDRVPNNRPWLCFVISCFQECQLLPGAASQFVISVVCEKDVRKKFQILLAVAGNETVVKYFKSLIRYSQWNSKN